MKYFKEVSKRLTVFIVVLTGSFKISNIIQTGLLDRGVSETVAGFIGLAVFYFLITRIPYMLKFEPV